MAGMGDCIVWMGASIAMTNCSIIFTKFPNQGEISADFIANCIILKENPLADIKNLRSIKDILYRGKLLNLDSLEAIYNNHISTTR